MDFAQGSDHIRLTNSGFADFTALQAAMTTVAGTHTLITFSTGATLQINNILPGQLQSTDFEFTTAAEVQTGKTEVSETSTATSVAEAFAFDFSDLPAVPDIEAAPSALSSEVMAAAMEPASAVHFESGDFTSDLFGLHRDHFTFDGLDDGNWHVL